MKKILIIAGPTGVGKTELSIEVAKKYDGEIISADSMQIYKKLDIGTAKISNDEMQGIRHHLIDIVDPDKEFSVYDFKMKSEEKIDEVLALNKKPIVVGGTGLYINTLIYDMDFNNSNEDKEYREYLWNFYKTNGQEKLFELLLEVDKNTIIEKQNIKRVIRALEIYKTTGKIEKFSQMKYRNDISHKIYILERKREELYDNINKRVDLMIKKGLFEEVENLYKNGLNKNHQSMKAIGYSQVLKYFDGEYTKEEAIEEIKKESRRYAKRQITWFKRYKDAIWIDLSEKSLKKVIFDIEF